MEFPVSTISKLLSVVMLGYFVILILRFMGLFTHSTTFGAGGTGKLDFANFGVILWIGTIAGGAVTLWWLLEEFGVIKSGPKVTTPVK